MSLYFWKRATFLATYNTFDGSGTFLRHQSCHFLSRLIPKTGNHIKSRIIENVIIATGPLYPDWLSCIRNVWRGLEDLQKSRQRTIRSPVEKPFCQRPITARITFPQHHCMDAESTQHLNPSILLKKSTIHYLATFREADS